MKRAGWHAERGLTLPLDSFMQKFQIPDRMFPGILQSVESGRRVQKLFYSKTPAASYEGPSLTISLLHFNMKGKDREGGREAGRVEAGKGQ